MNRRDRRAAGKSQTSSNGAGESTPAAFCEAGLDHMRAGRHLDAQVCVQQALAIDSSHAGSLHLMGLLSLHAKQYDHAVEWISRAIRQDPKPEYLSSLGTTLQQQGRYEEALKVFDKAVQLKPDAVELWKNLGNVLIDLNRRDQALLSFQQVLKLEPHRWDAASACGVLLQRMGRLEEALSYFSLCDALQPNQVLTLHMRTACLCGLGRFEEALTNTKQALSLDPKNADLHNNVGAVLQSLGRDDEALEWFDQALEIRSSFTETLHNRAASLTKTRQLDEAFAIYHRLLIADSNDALAEVGLAHLHLLTGNFEAGWAGREARWKLPSFSASYPKFSQPMWRGNETLEGKTVLIASDEGFGDTIQFSRYVPMVAKLGAHVVLAVQDSLRPLLSNLPGVSQCISISEKMAFPPFDAHCPIMSLPLAFGTTATTIPAPASYLPLPPGVLVQAWENRLAPPPPRKGCGSAWSGPAIRTTGTISIGRSRWAH